jgi:hypothetical protein
MSQPIIPDIWLISIRVEDPQLPFGTSPIIVAVEVNVPCKQTTYHPHMDKAWIRAFSKQ